MTKQELIEKIKNGECVGADLQGANLMGADLQGADLRGADLRGADLDFSAWPLWCGSKHVKVDIKLIRQLIGHICVMDCDNKEAKELQSSVLEFAKKGHRARNLDLI